MRTTGMVVEFGSGDLSPMTPFRKECQCVVGVLDADFFETLDEYPAFTGVVEDLEAAVVVLVLGCHAHRLGHPCGCREFVGKEVAKFFVVELDEGDFNAVVCFGGFEVVKEAEEDAGYHPCVSGGVPHWGGR